MPHFTVVHDYPAPPLSHGSACALCGSNRGPEEAVINTGLHVDVHDSGIYGLMHLCASCVVEMGRLVGMIDPTEADKLRLRAALEADEAKRLEARVAELNYVEDLLRQAAPPQPAPVEHDEAKPIIACPDCDKTFTHPLPLSAHRKRAHA